MVESSSADWIFAWIAFDTPSTFAAVLLTGGAFFAAFLVAVFFDAERLAAKTTRTSLAFLTYSYDLMSPTRPCHLAKDDDIISRLAAVSARK